MIERVLVPMDDSEMAKRALRYALEAHPDADITVLHSAGEPSTMMGKATALALANDIEEAAQELAHEIFDDARAIAAEYDREVDTVLKIGHPTRQILDEAENFDALVIGTHGGSIADRLLVGNVAETLFRRSPVPITVVR